MSGPGVVAAVQAAGTVYMVKPCPGAYDRELSTLCDPATGAPVLVVTYWPQEAAPGTAPTVEAYNANGTAYAGSIAALEKCGGERWDISDKLWFCISATQVSISRVDILDVSEPSAPVVAGSIWQDATGAVIPTPAAGSYAVGACSLAQYDAEESLICSAGQTLTRVRFYDRVTRVLAATEYRDQNNAVVPQSAGQIAGHTEGACVAPTSSIKVESYGFNYASPALAADYDPNGNGPIWTPPGVDLQSVTVVVRKAGTKPGGPDRVRVDTPLGEYFLVQGDTRTWSVAQHADMNEVLLGISTIEAEGNSAFDVLWTVHP